MKRGVALSLLLALWAALAACSDRQATDPDPPPSDRAVQSLPLAAPVLNDPSHVAPPDEAVQFRRGTLIENDPAVSAPATLAFGPDGRLYVGQLNGQITALTLEGQRVAGEQVIVPAGVLGNVLGVAFNPADPPDPVTLYVSHTRLYAGEEGAPFAGTVSKLVGPAFEPERLITGLPVSTTEHGTNGLAFDREGRLYIAQGGTTNAGVPSEHDPRPETPLSGAVLVADVSQRDFDGTVHYDPPREASDRVDQGLGDVRVFASGFRNPYDLVVHTNGKIYTTDNGPNAPDGARSLGCDSDGPGPSAADELDLVVKGGYYGHPNRNRGRSDERQCTYHAPDEAPGESTPPLATLAYFVSADGMVEYTSDAFAGRLRGNLIYVEWARGRVWRVMLADDGLSVVSISQLVADTLQQPLDVTVGPDGTVYVAEIGADRISYFAPTS